MDTGKEGRPSLPCSASISHVLDGVLDVTLSMIPSVDVATTMSVPVCDERSGGTSRRRGRGGLVDGLCLDGV